ncbi:MAG: FG-GAP repeat domain-containing protein [Eubacterium sp.]
MKKLRIPALLLCLCLLLSGCSFRLDSIDGLISPVALSGDNADVQQAVDEYCKSGYSLKIPSGGDYTTSFIFYDLNNDGINEAVAFYEPSDSVGTVNMAVISKSSDGWQVVDNIKGGGSDIICVDFCDVNNDSLPEILVCWSIISKSSNYNLCVYRQADSDGGISLSKLTPSVTAENFVCTDLNEDGVNEVLVFCLGSASSSPKAELYSFKGNSGRLIGETKLDSSIISYSSITAGKTDQGTSVFVDALKTDGQSMVTELIYWSDYYNSIVSPFYSYDTGKTADTTRKNLIRSRDIDSDKTTEIPLNVSKKNLPKEIGAENWMYYKNTVLNHKCYSFSCAKDKYILVVKDSEFKKLTVKYDGDNRQLTAYTNSGKQECFKIKTVISAGYNPGEYEGYTQIFSNGGFIYLASVNSKSDLAISIDDLKSMIKSY